MDIMMEIIVCFTSVVSFQHHVKACLCAVVGSLRLVRSEKQRLSELEVLLQILSTRHPKIVLVGKNFDRRK